MKRYHPILVVLHWLLAIMIVTGLIMGFQVLSATPNDAPEKLFYLKMHMTMGLVIVVLMVLRLLIRLLTSRPPAADIGNTVLNKLGVATHYLFYLVVVLLALSGLATANMAGLPDIVFGGSGAPLPASFNEFPPRMAHGALASVLLLLIVGHVLAFLYHQAFLDKAATEQLVGKSNVIPLTLELVLGSFQPKLFGERRDHGDADSQG